MPLTLRPPRRPSAQQSTAASQLTPRRVLLSCTAVLLLLFAASFTVGRLVGPLAPGDFPGSGSHGGGSMPGMAGMSGMTMPGVGAPAPQPVNSTAGGGR